MAQEALRIRDGRVAFLAVIADPPRGSHDSERRPWSGAPSRRLVTIGQELQAVRERDPERSAHVRGKLMTTTRIANADLVIAYEPGEDTHVYRRDCDVVLDESRIIHLGPGYQGTAEATIDGKGLMVMPGLVNVHSHPASEPGNKGMTDEVGSPKLYNSSLYEYLWLFRADAEGIPHLDRMAWSELLMSGVTTLVDLSFPSAGWIDRAAESGLRMVLAPMFRNGR